MAGGRILDESEVTDVSRSIRSFVPASTESDDQIKVLERLCNDVLSTCAELGLSTGHRVAAWNTLCSIIDQSIKSKNNNIQKIIWINQVWTKAFEIYISQAHHARPKSSRQLLTSLVGALRKAPHDDVQQTKNQITGQLLTFLTSYEAPAKAKASAQLLSSLLAKDVISLDLVLTCRDSHVTGAAENKHNRLQGLLVYLFRWLGDGDFGSSIAQLITALLDKYAEIEAEDSDRIRSNAPVWSTPLADAVQRYSIHVSDLRAHILPTLFKQNFASFEPFLYAQGLERLLQPDYSIRNTPSPADSGESDLLLMSLQTGREMGLLKDTEDASVIRCAQSLAIPIKAIRKLLFRNSRTARLTGLSFLITSHSVTSPLCSTAINIVKQSVPSCFTDVDADFRSDFFSLIQKLVDRIRAITAALARRIALSVTENDDPAAERELLISHRKLLSWLVDLIAWQLRPTASYQCHISALKCLVILARSGLDKRVPREYYSKSATGETKWCFNLDVISRDSQKLLLELISDPFDDVRQTAALVMSYLTSLQHQPQEEFQSQLLSSLEAAESAMLATGRADQADGVAHLNALSYRTLGNVSLSATSGTEQAQKEFLLNLIGKLESMLQTAHEDLSQALKKYPMHGLLTSIRYTLAQGDISDADEIRIRLFKALSTVWEIVKSILCHDAPEGYLPDELDEAPDSTKEALSYCWRALKEASLLLGRLIGTMEIIPAPDQNVFVKEMADLCFTQLAELRHRGAFSTVAQTWALVCLHCSEVHSSNGKTLLEEWYERILNILRNNVTINTRRSAGLPALLCGILIASNGGGLVSRAFKDLQSIASNRVDTDAVEEGSLPQVHALNCIKDVLKNSRLGEVSENHVPESLRLAADALHSDVWAIRNCGLMLFRAVIDRLLGTSEAHFDETAVVQKRILAEQHPEVLDVVLGLLQASVRTGSEAQAANEGVFPALQLLQYTQVTPDDLQTLKAPLSLLMANFSWHIRDKAAKTYAYSIDAETALDELLELLHVSTSKHNAVHGILLALRSVILLQLDSTKIRSRLHPETPNMDLKDLHDAVHRQISAVYNGNDCAIIKAASIDVLRALRSKCVLSAGQDAANVEFPIPTNLIDIYAELSSSHAQDCSSAILRRALARFYAHQQECNTSDFQTHVFDVVLRLQNCDENACASFLTELGNNTQSADDKRALAAATCTEILLSSSSVNLKVVAQHVLLTLSPQDLERDTEHPLANGAMNMVDVNQRFVDQDLELESLKIEAATSRDSLHPLEMLQLIEEWAKHCVTAVTGNGLHTREAAAFSMYRIKHAWAWMRSRSELDVQFLNLCIATYDLMRDDDEEIRTMAATITGRMLSGHCNPSAAPFDSVEPIAASRKILQFCCSRWSNNQNFLEIAFNRAFSLAQPVAHQLACYAQPDTALFARERDNLYIDDANEVKAWSQVLLRISPQVFSHIQIKKLTEWIMDGLCALQDRARGSFKAEIFTLGLSTIYGAELILHLAAQNWIIPERPSVIRAQLLSTKANLDQKNGNILWRWEIERVYNASICVKVARLGSIFTQCMDVVDRM